MISLTVWVKSNWKYLYVKRLSSFGLVIVDLVIEIDRGGFFFCGLPFAFPGKTLELSFGVSRESGVKLQKCIGLGVVVFF